MPGPRAIWVPVYLSSKPCWVAGNGGGPASFLPRPGSGLTPRSWPYAHLIPGSVTPSLALQHSMTNGLVGFWPSCPLVTPGCLGDSSQTSGEFPSGMNQLCELSHVLARAPPSRREQRAQLPSWENPNTNTLEQSKAGPFSTLSSFHGLTLPGLRLGDGGWVSLLLEYQKVGMGSLFLCLSVFLWLYSSFASLAGWDWVLFFFPLP